MTNASQQLLARQRTIIAFIRNSNMEQRPVSLVALERPKHTLYNGASMYHDLTL